MLDRKIRDRLRSLAEYDARLLDAPAQARLLRRVAAEGPSIVRRARAERIVTMSGGFALAAAACLALVLGVRAPAIYTPSVAAERADIPEVVIALPTGRMTLSAAQFGEGALRITTPQGDVVTQDAVLAVESKAQTLSVEVADGTAVIRGRGAEQRVNAGSRLDLSGDTTARRALDAASRTALRRAVKQR